MKENITRKEQPGRRSTTWWSSTTTLYLLCSCLLVSCPLLAPISGWVQGTTPTSLQCYENADKLFQLYHVNLLHEHENVFMGKLQHCDPRIAALKPIVKPKGSHLRRINIRGFFTSLILSIFSTGSILASFLIPFFVLGTLKISLSVCALALCIDLILVQCELLKYVVTHKTNHKRIQEQVELCTHVFIQENLMCVTVYVKVYSPRAVISSLLLMAGDIESNPGPTTPPNSSGSKTDSQLPHPPERSSSASISPSRQLKGEVSPQRTTDSIGIQRGVSKPDLINSLSEPYHFSTEFKPTQLENLDEAANTNSAQNMVPVKEKTKHEPQLNVSSSGAFANQTGHAQSHQTLLAPAAAVQGSANSILELGIRTETGKTNQPNIKQQLSHLSTDDEKHFDFFCRWSRLYRSGEKHSHCPMCLKDLPVSELEVCEDCESHIKIIVNSDVIDEDNEEHIPCRLQCLKPTQMKKLKLGTSCVRLFGDLQNNIEYRRGRKFCQTCLKKLTELKVCCPCDSHIYPRALLEDFAEIHCNNNAFVYDLISREKMGANGLKYPLLCKSCEDKCRDAEENLRSVYRHLMSEPDCGQFTLPNDKNWFQFILANIVFRGLLVNVDLSSISKFQMAFVSLWKYCHSRESSPDLTHLRLFLIPNKPFLDTQMEDYRLPLEMIVRSVRFTTLYNVEECIFLYTRFDCFHIVYSLNEESKEYFSKLGNTSDVLCWTGLPDYLVSIIYSEQADINQRLHTEQHPQAKPYTKCLVKGAGQPVNKQKPGSLSRRAASSINIKLQQELTGKMIEKAQGFSPLRTKADKQRKKWEDKLKNLRTENEEMKKSIKNLFAALNYEEKRTSEERAERLEIEKKLTRLLFLSSELNDKYLHEKLLKNEEKYKRLHLELMSAIRRQRQHTITLACSSMSLEQVKHELLSQTRHEQQTPWHPAISIALESLEQVNSEVIEIHMESYLADNVTPNAIFPRCEKLLKKVQDLMKYAQNNIMLKRSLSE